MDKKNNPYSFFISTLQHNSNNNDRVCMAPKSELTVFHFKAALQNCKQKTLKYNFRLCLSSYYSAYIYFGACLSILF